MEEDDEASEVVLKAMKLDFLMLARSHLKVRELACAPHLGSEVGTASLAPSMMLRSLTSAPSPLKGRICSMSPLRQARQ